MTARLTFERFRKGGNCEIELTGPAIRRPGFRSVRTIHLDADSPRIRFHATMQNIDRARHRVVDAICFAI